MTLHEPGLCIDGFEDLALIGRGGSSDVYRGVDAELGRTVAIKVLRFDGRSTDPTRLFFHECQATERLSDHPHIATVHRSGVTADGRPYVVVEDATNGSVADEVMAGPLELERVAEIGRAVASALAFAHSSGVQHRDVKPSNVLVAADGTPLLADFGLAAVAGSVATTVSGLPYTLAYAPPEVLRARPPDERSDVYSLGATLYELLEGRPPFAELGLTMPEVLARTLNSPVPPITRDDVPRRVRDLVIAMLSPDPSTRPGLDEVIAVLDDPRADGPSPTRRGGRTRRRATFAVGVLVAVALVCGAMWWVAREDGTPSSAASGTGTGAASSATSTTQHPAAPAPYRDGVDESPTLAASMSATTAATAAIIDQPPVSLPMGAFLPSPAFPTIWSFPDRTRWRFSHQSDAAASCWEYFPSEVNMTGFAATARTEGHESVIVAHYAFENADEAAQIFRGRSIALGITAGTCRVVGADVRIDQRTAPVRDRPQWADQVSSWTLGSDQRGPQEQVAVAYLFRVGRTLWELRLGSGDAGGITSTELHRLIDAVGTDARA